MAIVPNYFSIFWENKENRKRGLAWKTRVFQDTSCPCHRLPMETWASVSLLWAQLLICQVKRTNTLWFYLMTLSANIYWILWEWFIITYVNCSILSRLSNQQQQNLLFALKLSWILEKEWQPTPVFLPGKSHGQRSLAGYSPWGHKELEQLSKFHQHCGERKWGNTAEESSDWVLSTKANPWSIWELSKPRNPGWFGPPLVTPSWGTPFPWAVWLLVSSNSGNSNWSIRLCEKDLRVYYLV